jgi:hypothetical protein
MSTATPTAPTCCDCGKETRPGVERCAACWKALRRAERAAPAPPPRVARPRPAPAPKPAPPAVPGPPRRSVATVRAMVLLRAAIARRDEELLLYQLEYLRARARDWGLTPKEPRRDA